MKPIIILLTVFLTLPIMSQEKIQPVISVTGEGIVKIVPDQVIINLTIENTGDDLIKVKAENDKSVDAVIKQLKQSGIADKDIQTKRVDMGKNYDYNTKQYQFRATQSITVLLRNLDKYESLVSNLLTHGLNRIDGIQFGSSKMDELMSEARVKAVQNAKKKAEEYAGALAQKVGKAVQIQEPGQGYNPPILRMAKMETAYDGGGQQTLAPGEMEVSVQVIVVFELL
ncbi:MAG TPA: SIMPL domain-containing protein [Flavobacteriaceae bacterium]|nr:SIMPL domain-containing protein [Flavobacteriaceae bacterium]